MKYKIKTGFAITIYLLTAGSLVFSFAKQKTGDNIYGTYSKNLQICIGSPGSSNEKVLTAGFPDYKPSWSPGGQWIVFFRVVGNHGADISRWKTAIFIIKPDGSDLRQLTGGKYADYNPTWTRDGSNTIIINRFDADKKKSVVYLTTVHSKPGDEYPVSDTRYSEFAFTASKDGRLLITSTRDSAKNLDYFMANKPDKDGFYQPPFLFALTPEFGTVGKYEPLRFKYKLNVLTSRLTLSPSDRKITYELDPSYGNFSYNGHPLATADIDMKTLAISNEIVFSKPKNNVCELYPAWTKDEKGIIYFSNRSGKFLFYYYDLLTQNTWVLTTNAGMEYSYFCGEAVPK